MEGVGNVGAVHPVILIIQVKWNKYLLLKWFWLSWLDVRNDTTKKCAFYWVNVRGELVPDGGEQ